MILKLSEIITSNRLFVREILRDFTLPSNIRHKVAVRIIESFLIRTFLRKRKYGCLPSGTKHGLIVKIQHENICNGRLVRTTKTVCFYWFGKIHGLWIQNDNDCPNIGRYLHDKLQLAALIYYFWSDEKDEWSECKDDDEEFYERIKCLIEPDFPSILANMTIEPILFQMKRENVPMVFHLEMETVPKFLTKYF